MHPSGIGRHDSSTVHVSPPNISRHSSPGSQSRLPMKLPPSPQWTGPGRSGAVVPDVDDVAGLVVDEVGATPDASPDEVSPGAVVPPLLAVRVVLVDSPGGHPSPSEAASNDRMSHVSVGIGEQHTCPRDRCTPASDKALPRPSPLDATPTRRAWDRIGEHGTRPRGG
ncbi:hypothetical protein [Nannocystis sp.]|uniref:hypothetical protein n=1 Tax=Nannocystis sp. TaxID=1962667 RepID=UPI0025ECE472|nr:hypothetical protein [Nannocystis sp.]